MISLNFNSLNEMSTQNRNIIMRYARNSTDAVATGNYNSNSINNQDSIIHCSVLSLLPFLAFPWINFLFSVTKSCVTLTPPPHTQSHTGRSDTCSHQGSLCDAVLANKQTLSHNNLINFLATLDSAKSKKKNGEYQLKMKGKKAP